MDLAKARDPEKSRPSISLMIAFPRGWSAVVFRCVSFGLINYYKLRREHRKFLNLTILIDRQRAEKGTLDGINNRRDQFVLIYF